MIIQIPPELQRVLEQTPELRQAYLVGGCVRDQLLNLPTTDFDIEVFGVEFEELAHALQRWGKADLVGRSFGVVKLAIGRFSFDFTLPRRDSKVAPGHKGFEVQFDPSIAPKEAAARRDFTINSIMYNPRSDELLDFFGGIDDLNQRVLRHTSDAFPEDPLRVLRGMQFVARFDLRPAPETIAISAAIKTSYPELAAERVREEWIKWASRSTVPSAGLRFLVDTQWVEHFPELAVLSGTPQEPEWHPEGDVFVHTCHCLDALVRLEAWQRADWTSRTVYTFAVLTHDFGKPVTTHQALRDGQMRIVSPGHEEAGGPLAKQFLERIHVPRAIQERVVPLVLYHLAHIQTLSERAVRRLAKRLEPESIDGLSVVITADHMGRPPKPADVPEGLLSLRKIAEELKVKDSAPKPLLLGRHLIDAGLAPGAAFAGILKSAFEAQLDGEFVDLPGAFRWLSTQEHPLLTSAVRGRLRDMAAR